MLVDEINALHNYFTTYFNLFYTSLPMFLVMEFNALTLNNVTNSFLNGTLSKKSEFQHL